MPLPTTMTIFGVDNGHIELYKLNAEQFGDLVAKDDWETIDKFKIDFEASDNGYVPEVLVYLAEQAGWHTDSN